MVLFSLELSEVETRILDNIKKTKSVFPEETQRIEFGLALMHDITQITQDAVNEYKTKPNMYANHNLFARNRQLLLNAYFCLLCSSYGTQFIILRTVLENNILMRLFNKTPQFAFEWLPKEKQEQFSEETILKYGKSNIEKREFKGWKVRKHLFGESQKKKVERVVAEFHKQLSNYAHSNFSGWRELVGILGETEVILNMPRFQPENTDKAIGLMLYLTQISFKSFHDTFKGYLGGYADRLKEWQDNYNKLIVRYID